MTIREIAAIAGVSPAAVSLVMNNKKGVSEETRRRVMSVVEECGYAPALQKKKVERFRLMVLKFRAHGIALEENQGFIASIIDRIESECRRFAFDLIMCNCEAKTAAATIRELMQSGSDIRADQSDDVLRHGIPATSEGDRHSRRDAAKGAPRLRPVKR